MTITRVVGIFEATCGGCERGLARARRSPAGVGGMTARVMITWDGTFDDSLCPLAAGRGPVRPDPIDPAEPALTGCE